MNEGQKKHIIELLDKGIRLDGRKSTEYRKPIIIECDVSKNAEGSARVQIGDSVMETGVKMSLDTPYPDTPDEGCLMIGAELLPMASPDFELGPPSIKAIELARIVDRGIREAKAIDMKKMCIKKGEKAWGVSIDMCPINDSGNLFDIGALSSIAALKDTKIPKLDGEIIDYKSKTKEGLPLTKLPLSVTVFKIGQHFIVDPIPEEEAVIDARLSVATDEKGNICALQKGGEEPLSIEEIDQMLDIGIEKGNELRKLL